LAGHRVGPEIKTYFEEKYHKLKSERDKGSIIMVVATDLPVTHRQLMRIIKRAGAGIARTGSVYGNGSGDIVLGFSTAHTIFHDQIGMIPSFQCISDNDIDAAFHAVAEATEEAVLNALVTAGTATGYDGRVIYGLSEWLEIYSKNY